MKFFTRAWTHGEMADEDFEAVPSSYSAYLTTLRLPASIEALLKINPHDAFILAVAYQPECSLLALKLRCGDFQRGYSDVSLAFSEVRMDRGSLDMLRSAVWPAQAEVLYDEVDRSGELFEYRLLLYPDGEVSFRFLEVGISEQPVPHREVGICGDHLTTE
jgi:hypothetical protein